jgi:nicotinate-nucleotide adenylyltransferase
VSIALPRIGVFGALCNPPHIGHLILCQEALWQLGLSRVVIVPTGTPPHRDPPPQSPEVRLRLAQAAVAGNPRFAVSRVEVDRPGPCYTVDTLAALNERYAGSSLVLLLGADQVAAFGEWHRPDRIVRLARIAAARRPGVDVEPSGDLRDVEWIDMPQLDVSSSAIRARVAAGRPIRYLVPDAVAELIAAEGLYRNPAGAPEAGVVG